MVPLRSTQIFAPLRSAKTSYSRETEGAGVISADINLKPSNPSEALTNRFWIPKLPLRFHFFWHQQNWSAKGLYRYAKKNNLLKALQI